MTVCMREITLHRPEIQSREVLFRWTSAPQTSLYRQTQFTLRFPAELDLTQVPEGLWWRIAFICLHAHWTLLRPCRILLPISLEPGEAEVWLRLMDVEIATLEAYRGTTQHIREIEIIEDGPRPALTPLPDARRAATAFSGGKDSLLQTGLLSELTERPVLVATTSPTPGREDHTTPRRREILAGIVRRRPLELIEVESDYRANLAEKYAQESGYPIALNEMTDTFLYLGALIAAGASRGVTHFFMASETEVQENVEIDGRVVQHKHFMYSQITLSAIDAAIRPWGLRCSSLTPPLHSYQVQQLLWQRYRDLRDLQYSCWRVTGDEWACSACSQCLRIALSVLSIDDQPSVCGLDLTRALIEMRGWQARRATATAVLPNDAVSVRLHAQVMRSVLAVRLPVLLRALTDGRPMRLLTGRFWRAALAFLELRLQAMDHRPGPLPGYRAGFCRYLDPLVADRVAEIYAEHFSPEEETGYARGLARSGKTACWITEAMRSERHTGA